jgi:branched-subunit amino acid transport protein
MSEVNIWLTIIGLMVVTFVTRGFFLLFGHRAELPDSLVSALRYAPAAALIAIIAPEVFLARGEVFDPLNPSLWGGLTALGVFLLSRGMVLTIVAGMLVFTAVRWLI